MIELGLIYLFISYNAYILYKYYRIPLGIFMPPFLASSVVFTVLIPQLFTIYLSDYYSDISIPLLLYTMLSCHVAFNLGFKFGFKSRPLTKISDINLRKSKKIILILAVVGAFAAFKNRGIWMNSIEGAEKSTFIIFVNVANYLELAFLFSIVYLVRINANKKIYWMVIIVATLFFLESIILLGRRNLSLRLVLNIGVGISLLYPKFYRYVRIMIVLFFFVGAILNASISSLRTNLSTQNSAALTQTDLSSYIDNYKKNFLQTDFSIGMDLGNAAKGIMFCEENLSFDYGLSIWNGFVFNFIPRFLVGQPFKDSISFKVEYSTIVKTLTSDVTTMTGYFDAFASFGYFAFMKFLFLGYILGYILSMSINSNLYLILYLFIFSQITSIITHGSQPFFMRIEFFTLFFFPLFYYFHVKKTITK